MITYEVNIICDACGNECVSGNPFDELDAAKASAIEAAKSERWENRQEEWFCSKCVSQGPQS